MLCKMLWLRPSQELGSEDMSENDVEFKACYNPMVLVDNFGF